MLRKWLPSTQPASDDSPPCSRKATTYLMRGFLIMGIRRPPKQIFLLYCLWSFFLNLNSTFYQPIAFGISYYIHFGELPPAEFLTSIQVSFNALSCSIKVVIIWLLQHRLDSALDVLDILDQRVTKKEERRIIHNAVARSNLVFFIYLTIYLIYVTIAFLDAAAHGRPTYQNYYPMLDWHSSKLQLYLQCLLEFYAMGGAAFMNVCCDCYPLNYMIMLRAHMRILKQRFRQLGQDPEENADQRYESLINCIRDHRTILRLTDCLGPVISGTIFVQFCVVGIVLGLTLINIVMFADLTTSISTFNLMVAVMMETTPFCILCNYLVDDCNDLATALFQSNWIEGEQRYKKTVLFFLQNLQRPIIFTAMNVFSITVSTNITVTKFAFSVFTLVKEMDIAEKFSNAKKP